MDLLREADLRHRFLDVHITVRAGPQNCNLSASIVQKIVRALIRVGPISLALEDLAGRGCLKPKVFQHRSTLFLNRMSVEMVLEFHVRTDAEEDGDGLEMLEGVLMSEAETLRLPRA